MRRRRNWSIEDFDAMEIQRSKSTKFDGAGVYNQSINQSINKKPLTKSDQWFTSSEVKPYQNCKQMTTRSINERVAAR